jgi:hypothetical protein
LVFSTTHIFQSNIHDLQGEKCRKNQLGLGLLRQYGAIIFKYLTNACPYVSKMKEINQKFQMEQLLGNPSKIQTIKIT